MTHKKHYHYLKIGTGGWKSYSSFGCAIADMFALAAKLALISLGEM